MVDRQTRVARHLSRCARPQMWWLMLVAMVIAVALPACGSSSSNSASSSASSSAAPASAQSSSGSTGAGSSCAAQAKEVVAKAEAPLTIKAPSQTIKMHELQGKTVYFVSLPSGYSLRLWNGFAAAARAAGLDPVFGAGASPEQWNTAIQQAVERHAAGIVIMAVTPSLVASSLAQAKAAGIPVVSQNTIPPAPTAAITSTVLVPNSIGVPVAAYAALTAKCRVNALFPVDPSFPGLVTVKDAMQAELTRLCPTSCKSQSMAVSVATMATEAAPALQSALQRDSSINAVIPGFDSLALLMQPALAQSGGAARLYGIDGDAPNLALVRKGLLAADNAYAPTDYQGYIDLDALARAMLKVKATPPAVQLQLFTPSTIPSSDSFAALWPKLVGFQHTFMKLWGLA